MELKIPDASYIESLTLCQEPDSCEDSDSEYQRLKIDLGNAGEGHFVRLSTDRWSIDDIDGLAETLKQLIEQADSLEKETLAKDPSNGKA